MQKDKGTRVQTKFECKQCPHHLGHLYFWAVNRCLCLWSDGLFLSHSPLRWILYTSVKGKCDYPGWVWVRATADLHVDSASLHVLLFVYIYMSWCARATSTRPGCWVIWPQLTHKLAVGPQLSHSCGLKIKLNRETPSLTEANKQQPLSKLILFPINYFNLFHRNDANKLWCGINSDSRIQRKGTVSENQAMAQTGTSLGVKRDARTYQS